MMDEIVIKFIQQKEYEEEAEAYFDMLDWACDRYATTPVSEFPKAVVFPDRGWLGRICHLIGSKR